MSIDTSLDGVQWHLKGHKGSGGQPDGGGCDYGTRDSSRQVVGSMGGLSYSQCGPSSTGRGGGKGS